MIDLFPLVAQAGPNALPYFDPVLPDRELVLYSARPTVWHPGLPVLFVHHGVGRNGQDYRDYWLPHADANGMLVIAIEFPQAGFPEYLCYNFGNLHAIDGTPNPRKLWTFGIGPRLFDTLRGQGVTSTERYGLFGHSAGGQYVHRMLSFGYRDRVAVAVSANAGTYAMPDMSIDWPWGLGATDVTTDDLRRLLGFPLTLMAGTEDTKTSGRFFPKGVKSMKQGPTRYARAHTYLRTAQDAAAALHVPLQWRVIDVPGVGHDGRRMSDAAAPVIIPLLRARVMEPPSAVTPDI
ncbi:alpha/beta hydrolase [Rhodopila sp.]|uniref:alpha/beta hydrolase n=1 Tax=Rhodopila sp. TaxID=2480087 RepID=UPI003D0E8ECE